MPTLRFHGYASEEALAFFGLAHFGRYVLSAIAPSQFVEVFLMTDIERELMEYLCQRIAVEKDPTVFGQLVNDLNELLEVKHQRIHLEHKRGAPPECGREFLIKDGKAEKSLV